MGSSAQQLGHLGGSLAEAGADLEGSLDQMAQAGDHLGWQEEIETDLWKIQIP